MPGSPDNLGDLPESRSAKIALKYCLKLDPPRLAGARNKIMCFLKNLGHSRPLFSLFSSFQQLTVNVFIIIIFPMTGLEPRTSGIESDRSAN